MKKNTPYRILFALNSPDLAGGALTGILQLVRALPEEEYRSYLVVPRPPTPEQYAVLCNTFDDIAVVRLGGSWIKQSKARPLHRRVLSEIAVNARTGLHGRTIGQLCRLIRRWDIDLVYSASALVPEPAVAAKISGVPHLWHIKELLGHQDGAQFYLPDRWLVWTINFLSSRIVVMSDFVGRVFEQHHQNAKVIKVYDGIEALDFEGVEGMPLRQRLGVQDGELLVGLIASLSAPWKKHGLFIDMAARLKDDLPQARFAHFGHIPSPTDYHWPYYDKLCRQIKDLGLEDRFIWAGVVTDMPLMLKSLDLLVHPTDVEPFGRVAIEAMAARVPVVAPAGGGLAESVVDGVTGVLVPPDSAQALADAALKLLQDRDLRVRMGEAGAAWVRERFSIQQHTREMMAVFDSILDERRMARHKKGVR